MILAFAGCGPSIPPTIKIGLLVEQTGSGAARGKDLLNGAVLAADEINAAGFKLHGKPVKIEIVDYDDKGSVDGAKAGAEQLLERGVSAVIGPVNTPQTAVAVPIVAVKGIPHFWLSTSTGLIKLGNGNGFRLGANDDLQGRAMARFSLETLGAKRIAIIAETGDYGSGLNKSFLATSPLAKERVVMSREIKLGDKVPRSMADDIKAANADLVVFFGREPQLMGIIAALAEVGFTNVNVLGTNVVRNKSVAAAVTPMKGLYAAATSIEAAEFPAGKAFVEAFQAKYKSSPVWGAHYTYDCVYAFTDAIRRTGSLDSAELIKTLKRIDPITRVNLTMRFSESGEQRYPNVAIYRVEHGAWAVQVMSANW